MNLWDEDEIDFPVGTYICVAIIYHILNAESHAEKKFKMLFILISKMQSAYFVFVDGTKP